MSNLDQLIPYDIDFNNPDNRQDTKYIASTIYRQFYSEIRQNISYEEFYDKYAELSQLMNNHIACMADIARTARYYHYFCLIEQVFKNSDRYTKIIHRKKLIAHKILGGNRHGRNFEQFSA